MTLLNDLACDRIDFNDDLTTGERSILSEVLGEFFDYNETIIQNEVIDVYRSLAPLIVDYEPEDLNTGSWYTNISSVILESLKNAGLEPSEEIISINNESFMTESTIEALWNELSDGGLITFDSDNNSVINLFDFKITYIDPSANSHAHLRFENESSVLELKYDPTLIPGPIFDIETGVLFGLSSNGMKGVPIFINNTDLNKVKYQNSYYSISDLIKYGTKIYDMPIGEEFEINAPTNQTIDAFNVISNAVNYIALATPLNNFPDKPNNVSSLLLNWRIATSYYGHPTWTNRIFTNNGSALNDITLAATKKEEGKITYNILHTKSSSDLLITVENIQSVFVHELMGHWIRGYGAYGGHYRAYDLQKEYINYDKTTKGFKESVNIRRNEYFTTYGD